MPRFFVEPKTIKGDKFSIRGREARHISTVLRLERGDTISIFDGTGKEYFAIIENAGDSGVDVRVIHEKFRERESYVEVTLFQGLPKSTKMDLIVEKCTEIGIHRIVPIVTSRVVPDIETGKMEERRSRWERIAKEASKQSGRTRVTEIGKIIPFKEAFKAELDLKIVPWEDERGTGLKDVLKKCRIEAYPCRIGIFIGPEGGFTRDEIGHARYNDAIPVSLGPNVLRTETAGLVTAAIVLYEFEPRVKNTITSDN